MALVVTQMWTHSEQPMNEEGLGQWESGIEFYVGSF